MITTIAANASLQSDGSVFIEGRSESLVRLSDALLRGDEVFLAPDADADDQPNAATIEVTIDSEQGISVAWRDDVLMFIGCEESLHVLAGNVSALGADPDRLGGRIHIDYFPEHPYLRPGSLPLLVIVT